MLGVIAKVRIHTGREADWERIFASFLGGIARENKMKALIGLNWCPMPRSPCSISRATL